jgi:copper(I)-binding protein
MNKFLTGLFIALFSIQGFAMSHGHSMSHQHQSTQFETVTVEGLTLSNFRARASIGPMKNSGAYGEIRSNTDDRLIKASSSVAKMVELHEHINDNGVMRMREVEGGVVLPAGESMVMQPGGYHIMLIGLHEPLKADSSMDLSLEFESGKTVNLSIPIVSIKKMHH